MGIKIGMAAYAASQVAKKLPHGLFIPANLNDNKPFPLAQIIFAREKSDVHIALRYPFGELGYLRFSDRQLEIFFIEEFQWVPTRMQMRAITNTLSPSRIVFDGTTVGKSHLPQEEIV